MYIVHAQITNCFLTKEYESVFVHLSESFEKISTAKNVDVIIEIYSCRKCIQMHLNRI